MAWGHARKIAGSGPRTAQGSAEAVAAAVPGLGVAHTGHSYVVKGRQRRDRWGAEIWNVGSATLAHTAQAGVAA
jgi:hypothetical protein